MKKMSFVSFILICFGLWAAPRAARASGPGVVRFDQSSVEVSEGAGVATVVVERSQGEDGAATVHYATSAGSATPGSDYLETQGTLSWSNGDSGNKTFNVPILDDTVAEGAETIVLTLSNATGASLDLSRATSSIVILSNDGGSGGGDNGGDDNGGNGGVFKFDEGDFEVVESAGMAVITVERSQGEGGAATVEYSTSDGTATAGADYTATSGVLSWAAGEEGSKTFKVPVINDSLAEGTETVELTLSNPTGGAAIDALRGTAVLRITDDGGDDSQPGDDDSKSPGVVKFDEAGFQVIEGGQALIRVERSRGEKGAISVHYATADGSATAGSDYTAVSGTLSWAAGEEGTRTFSVPVNDDGTSEGNETVELRLSSPTGGATIDGARGSAILTILDNDGDTSACSDDDDTLCLAGGRFKVEVSFRTPQGDSGRGHMIPQPGGNSGLVWFFSSDNIEMLVKVLDVCSFADRFWVFFAATTDVDFNLEVTDTATGLVKEYKNPLGQAAEPVQDTLTFETCP